MLLRYNIPTAHIHFRTNPERNDGESNRVESLLSLWGVKILRARNTTAIELWNIDRIY